MRIAASAGGAAPLCNAVLNLLRCHQVTKVAAVLCTLAWERHASLRLLGMSVS
jgi:hypothetical protein